ncbi:3-hydroxyacyl-ACP dehydratase [Mucilaginibacter ginsenosidivorax]|uniref:3-hydroxyacyl-ACP dehydratase n=1 Tax=Mucilaginibacter ginsenosidivorax TaxID=862126 RepID=A0A5B8W315_9SPHI|nr:3-hydroxyacyl-ACP dehydratase [Mucilaginibacter ginsenosidivorax]QEC76708.1 3-hydroxyacyl-ACP dehydratase [Mucilaginibacter ginsenosidivorax]
MLQESFFQFTAPNTDGNTSKTTITLNAGHQIFEGHFPGQPVVPGVCMMQMVKEVLENIIGTKTKLLKAGEMKFLAILNPQVNSTANMQITYTTTDDGSLKVDATIQHESSVFFKFKGVFKK